MGTRHGGDARGNSTDRRNRKTWLLSPEAGWGGTGETVPCANGCGTVLTRETLEADRINAGGSYGFSPPYPNCRPSCKPCNQALSNTAGPDWKIRAEANRRRLALSTA